MPNWFKKKEKEDTTDKKRKILTRATFFRIGVLACLVVSVWHGTHLFQTSNTTAFLGVDTSVLIAGTIDLGLWFLIDAMITTRKRGETGFSTTILVGIILLCFLSFVANYTYNERFYSPDFFKGVEFLNRQGVTLLQSSPPLIIIFMSVVGEVFVRPNDEEALDYRTVLEDKYMRKVYKLEARLKAQQREREILAQYTVEEDKHIPRLVQPVKWSFLWFKVYDVPMQQTVIPQDDNLQKLSVAIIHLEQKIEAIAQPQQPLQIEESKEQDRQTDKIPTFNGIPLDLVLD